ncbi:BEND4 protein, partial [Polypterus senegalus]
MQPAEEGPCVPKICKQRSPYSALKTFTCKKLVGKRYDRPTMVEIPQLGAGGGHHHHPQQHQQQHLQHQQPSIISSSEPPQPPFPYENGPGSKAATSSYSSSSTCPTVASLSSQQRHGSGRYAAALGHEPPDSQPGLSAANKRRPEHSYHNGRYTPGTFASSSLLSISMQNQELCLQGKDGLRRMCPRT